MKKTYISIILARKNSRRIKNKNLVKINGKPLINFTLDEIQKLIKKENIYISSDDLKINKI
tara:strand:+ start:561 stop:743 length:183 start_codon:yes stop_codon:yes gene_type:complete